MSNKKRGSKKKTKPPPKETFSNYIRTLGIPVALLGIGVGLMTTGYFRLGVWLFYTAAILLALDISRQPFFKPLPRPYKWLSGVMALVALLVFSAFWIFVPAPLEVSATSDVPNWGPESQLGGIKWNPKYAELQFSVKNPSPYDYENFDAEIQTDLLFKDVRQLHGLAACSVAPTHPPIDMYVQHYEHWQPSGPLNDPNNPTKYTVLPVPKDRTRPLAPSGTDWSYRIRCDKFPAKSESRFVAALLVLDPLRLFGAPQPANWISVQARFDTSGRGRSRPIKCGMNDTCVSPSPRSNLSLAGLFGFLRFHFD